MPSQFLRHSPSLGENHIHSTILPSGISSRKLATALFGTQTGIFRQKHHIIPSHFHYSCIVGYAGNKLQKGAALISPQFINVSGNNFSLSNFIPLGDDIENNVWIKVLNDFGGETASYCWINYGGENGNEICWSQDASGEKAENVSFPIGLSFWVQGTDVRQTLQSAGEVNRKDIVVQLQNGATITGNATPVAVSLDDILPSGDDVENNVWIKVLNDFGGEVASYCWINYGGKDSNETCWSQDASGEHTHGVVFSPGQGLWVQGTKDTQFITFPGVEF